MPLHHKPLLDAAVMLAELEEMKLTLKYSVGASALTAVAGCGASMLIGPAGFLVGSSIASLAIYGYTKNKFKPVYLILRDDLRPQQQTILIELIREGFKDVDISDLMKLAAFIMSVRESRLKMLTIVQHFIVSHFLQGGHNVDVQVKSQADLAMYGAYTEDYKKQHGLTGMVFPPTRADSGWGSASAPRWQPIAAANDAHQAPAQSPVLPRQSTTPDAPAVEDWERPDLPTVPKVSLKTTF